MDKDFNGVFQFSNWTTEDFSGFWNNKEYVFPANTMSPIIIPNESLENIQEIRKKWAYKLAVREWYNGKEYGRMKKMGGGLPPTFDEKILEPMIEKCLNPLPPSKVKVKEVKAPKQSFKASKAISEKDNVNFVFKDEPVEEKGKMPDSPTA